MKKLFSKISALFLGLAMAIGVGVAVASNGEAVPVHADSGTITFKGLTTSTSYVTTETESTNGGFTFKWKNMNPSSGQVRGNQTTQSNMLTGGNFYIFNTAAVSGSITNLTLKTTATGNNKFDASKIYAAVGTSVFTSLSTSATAGTASGTSVTWSFSGSNTFFAIGMQKGGTSNNVNGVTLEVTYSAATNYTVSFAVGQSGYGTVSSTSIANVPNGSAITTDGNKVTINGTTVTATPTATTAQYTYSFSSWSNTTGSVTADRTITANFTRETNSFSITKTYNNCSGNAPTSVQYGSSFTDTITPNAGYHVPSTVSVTVGSETRSVTPSGNKLTVNNVTGNVSYTVTCEINSYSITGNISDGTLSNDGESINHRTAYSGTINPTGTALLPDDKDDIVVTIGGSSTTNFDYDPSTGVVNIADQYVTGDIVITAACYYVYSISPSCVGGSVDYVQSDSNIRSDGTAMIQFVANEGYLLPSIDGISITSDNADIIEYADGLVEIGNATGNVTIVCTCIEITDKDIHVNVTNATASGDTTITIGREAKVNLVADDGYRLPYEDEFTVTGADADFEFNQEHTTVEISLSSCVDDVVISGSSVHRWNISTKITNGSCSPTSGVVDNGDEWSTTLSPNAHYKLPQKSDITVTMGGSSTDDFTYNNGTISLTNITGDVSISASMIALATYTVTFDLSQHISGPSSATIEERGIEEYEFTVSNGYYLPDEDEIIVEPNNGVDWSWVEESDTTGVLTISNPISDVTIQIIEKSDDLDHITLSPASGTYTLGDTLTMPTVTAYFTISDPRVLTEDEFTFSGECIDSKTKMLIKSGDNQTIKFSCTINNITKEATYSATVNAITPSTGGYKLVTNINELSIDDKVIIAASGADYALSTNQATNNRTGAAITKSDNSISWASGMDKPPAELTLKAGNKTNTYSFYTGSGYLYASSSSSNQLKTETDLSNNSSFTITISNNVASLTAQGSNSRNVMQYNPNNNNPIFACYSSASQQPLCLYKYYAPVEKELIRITAELKDKTKTFYKGDTVLVNDFNVTAHYNDETNNPVTDGFTLTNAELTKIGDNTVTVNYRSKSCEVVVNAIERTDVLTGLTWDQGAYVVIDNCQIDYSKFGIITAIYNYGESTAAKSPSACSFGLYSKSNNEYTLEREIVDGETITAINDTGLYLGTTYGENENHFTAYSSEPLDIVERLNEIKEKKVSYTWEKVTSVSAGDRIAFVYIDESKEPKVKKEANTFESNIIKVKDIENDEIQGVYPLIVGSDDNGHYTLKEDKENGQYLMFNKKVSSGNNEIYLKDTVDTQEYTTSWDIEFDGEDNAKIKSIYSIGTVDGKSTTRYIQYNTGSPRFACYTGAQKYMQIYKSIKHSDPIGVDIANTNAEVQKSVIEYTKYFNTTLSCLSSGLTTDVSTKWSNVSSKFTEIIDSFDGEDLEHFKSLFAYADAIVGGDKLQDMLCRYNYIVAKYQLTDFINEKTGRPLIAGSYINRYSLMNGEITNVVVIISVISLISIASVGAYFYIRRKKEN